MRLLSFSAVAFGLMTTAQAYYVIFYDKKFCNDDSEAKTYITYQGNDMGCINVGENPGSGGECARFEEGGVTRTDCGKRFSASSLYIEQEMTTFGGRDKCVDCQFFNDYDCKGDNVAQYNDNLCLNDGLTSFQCVRKERKGGCVE